MDHQATVEKPRPVATAVNILWISLAVGLVKALMDIAYLGSVAPAAFVNFVLIFTFVVIAFLIVKISAGRNWARITYLVLFVIGMLPALPMVFGEFTRSPVLGALSVAQVGLQVYGLFLLFTRPGKSWFRQVKAA